MKKTSTIAMISSNFPIVFYIFHSNFAMITTATLPRHRFGSILSGAGRSSKRWSLQVLRGSSLVGWSSIRAVEYGTVFWYFHYIWHIYIYIILYYIHICIHSYTCVCVQHWQSPYIPMMLVICPGRLRSLKSQSPIFDGQPIITKPNKG